MALDPETVGGWLAAAITTLLGKVGWERYQKNKQAQTQISDEELDLNKPLNRGQSLALWVSERIHKNNNELVDKFNNSAIIQARMQGELNELKLNLTYAVKEITENKAELNQSIQEIHRHIESNGTKMETSFKREIDRIFDFINKEPNR
jgi:hypothetical protein